MSAQRQPPSVDWEAEQRQLQGLSLQELLAALEAFATERDAGESTAILLGLNDITTEKLRAVHGAWQARSSLEKLALLHALQAVSEDRFDLDYGAFARYALSDSNEAVRVAALQLLWQDEKVESMRAVMQLTAQDPEPSVRLAAIKALGPYILLGEYGDMPADLARQAQSLALTVHEDPAQPLEMRRRALEALANSSHPRLPALIRNAYTQGNRELSISALFAMGASGSQEWRAILLNELHSGDNERVYEAATACGRLQIEGSVQRLGELVLSADSDVQFAAIAALGEIGGRRAINILSALADSATEEELLAACEVALDEASFGLGLTVLGTETG